MLQGVGPAASLAGSLGNGGRSADSLVLMLEVLPNMLIVAEAVAPFLNADVTSLPDQHRAAQRDQNAATHERWWASNRCCELYSQILLGEVVDVPVDVRRQAALRRCE